MTATITDLIYFVTISDILDPILREGLPHLSRQLLLREQQVLDRAMECIQVPFKHHYKFSELSSEKARNKPSVKPLHRMGVLCQRLARHILRENTANKIYAMRFVPSLQGQLGYGLRAAGTLTEVFADNEQLLDKVTDENVAMFINLIRQNGRQGRFVKFLNVLCQCNGKAVRTNQWRVCNMLVKEAPELLIRLRLRPATANNKAAVMVSGDPRYFPAFGEELSPGRSELEINEWLNITEASTAEYFELCIELASGAPSSAVRQRNLKNTPHVQKLLPYDVVLAIITSPELHADHLEVSAQFVGIARDLYVDNEPHELMTRVKTVRIWDNVLPAAESGKLSSRLTTGARRENVHSLAAAPFTPRPRALFHRCLTSSGSGSTPSSRSSSNSSRRATAAARSSTRRALRSRRTKWCSSSYNCSST